MYEALTFSRSRQLVRRAGARFAPALSAHGQQQPFLMAPSSGRIMFDVSPGLIEPQGTTLDDSGQYLIAVDSQKRESEALRRLCESRPMFDDFLALLDLPGGLFWVVQGMQHGELVAGRRGDVDLLAGRLVFEEPQAFERLKSEWHVRDSSLSARGAAYFAAIELAENGGLQWPPPLDYLVAIEAKCAHFDSKQSRVRSTKSSKDNVATTQLQVQELLRFVPADRVVLLDFIINPPSGGENFAAWLNAAAIADRAFRYMRAVLEHRLPAASPAGHFVLSWGAVEGGCESWRGAGCPRQLRSAIANPYLSEAEVRERRSELEENLQRILSQRHRPLGFPVIM